MQCDKQDAYDILADLENGYSVLNLSDVGNGSKSEP